MKYFITVFSVLLILSPGILFSQKVDQKQVILAQSFLHAVMKGENEQAWKLFDKASNPDVTRERFEIAMNENKNGLGLFDTAELTMNGIQFSNDRKLNLYTFKAISNTKNIVDQISVDVLFLDSSQLILAVRPKKLLKENEASTSSGKETPIEQGFDAVIDNVTYKITGINIVHFANNEGLLAIQIKYALPPGSERQETARKEAVKFAKYLFNNGYMEKAKIKAKETGRILLDNIGVSFLDPNNSSGYNIMVKPSEYK